MTDYRTDLHRLYRRWKSGAITHGEFLKRRAALKQRNAAQIKRVASRKRKNK